jgi:hypothetical protein
VCEQGHHTVGCGDHVGGGRQPWDVRQLGAHRAATGGDHDTESVYEERGIRFLDDNPDDQAPRQLDDLIAAGDDDDDIDEGALAARMRAGR